MASERASMIRSIITDVAELPDRTSPDDWPDAMLVTADELLAILETRLASTPQPSGEGWRDIASAPKDGRFVLAIVAPNDSRQLGHQAGRMFVIRHEGRTEPSGYDMGWSVYPGYGGASDHNFTHWMPLPATPKAQPLATTEREDIVAWLRRQSDKGSELALQSDQGTKRAAFGGGSLALKRAADAIEAGEHNGMIADLVRDLLPADGDLPDWDHPLRCVYESGIQYAVNLLAKTLGVEDYEVCDGTEEFDGDLGGTLFNIVLAAMPKDAAGDPMHPEEVRAALATPADEQRLTSGGKPS